MYEENNLNPADRELESALRSLSPTTVRIEPVTAAFEAGKRSMARRVRFWQSATVCSLAAVVGICFVPPRRAVVVPPVDHSTAVVAVNPEPALEPPSAQSVLMLEKDITEKGVDGLPWDSIPHGAVQRAGELF